jgi:hypothetical protein
MSGLLIAEILLASKGPSGVTAWSRRVDSWQRNLYRLAGDGLS